MARLTPAQELQRSMLSYCAGMAMLLGAAICIMAIGRYENSPTREARLLPEIEALQTRIDTTLATGVVCQDWDTLSPSETAHQLAVHRIPIDDYMMAVNQHNQLVDRYVAVLMRDVGGSQYRGVEATFPQKVDHCFYS